MKIEKSVSPLPSVTVGESNSRATAAKNADNKTASPENSGTSVSLGSTTAQLRSMGNDVNTPPIDANKVAQIKQAMSEGRFQVNSSVVADRLLSSVRDLLSAR
jgi:negative regulator of flagellin synthesis FlgM